MPGKNKTDQKLTPKQERFCREYVVDLNAAQAAIRAGYSPKDAHAQGARLSANVGIKKRIAELSRVKNDALDLKIEDTLREISGMAFAAPSGFEELRMNAKDKLKALEMLAKHQGLFTAADDGKGATAININVIKTAPGGTDARD